MTVDIQNPSRSLDNYSWTEHFQKRIEDERFVTQAHVAETLRHGQLQENHKDGNITFEYDLTGIVCYVVVDREGEDETSSLVTTWLYLYNAPLVLDHREDFDVDALQSIHEFNDHEESFDQAYSELS